MYFADSHIRTIFAFRFVREEGLLLERRVFATFAERDGIPDGATTDEEGCLWSAAFGAGQLIRFTPDGKVDRRIQMPVSRPTSCSFGGSDLRTLFVTSATHGLSAAERQKEPLAGGVFALDVGVAGRREPRYGG